MSNKNIFVTYLPFTSIIYTALNEIYALTKYDLLEEFILKHHNKEAISEDS